MSEAERQMIIADIFFLSDGRTILGGSIPAAIPRIPSCQCNLIDPTGVVHQSFLIEGEQIVRKIDPENDNRAVGTTENVRLSSEQARSGEWKLEFLT